MAKDIGHIKSPVMVRIYDLYIKQGIKSHQTILETLWEEDPKYKELLKLFMVNRVIHNIDNCGYNPYSPEETENVDSD
ncbi:hypothetical protein HWC21_gp011 [Vibrio phage VAP7]|uniref:Uncharacterized protein n=1 Tax=Vibrio phage VAP7 TaxID=2584487 RepID=A0A4Y5TV15_9CAUD|nr:hypothetical protein HWC21_gp011 [Vibrio phage VAP7]QDB73193.1 hypothetical protein [Vibrio phage VAP7]UFD98122.1 hypothetical protein [Vibrio phage BX-1]